MSRVVSLGVGLVAVAAVFLTPASSLGDLVRPSDRVVTHVRVREEPSTQSDTIGHLRPGDTASLIGGVPRWRRVRMGDGTVGFVSKAWTLVGGDAPGEPASAGSFEVHFLDVGTGDAAIVDMGDREIVIDGGNYVNDLQFYARENDLIQDPIELIVVTHADSDHWKGIRRLLNLDGRATHPHRVTEVWEPGYDRGCKPLASYDRFIDELEATPGIVVRRPLQATRAPATESGELKVITVPSLPGVQITLLHADQDPPTTGGCSYRINNASIVMMIEIEGVRFLFTGDANGKRRSEESPGTPMHIEALLLDLEDDHPGALGADVLKVPHHGSETASTQEFIDAVDPTFAVISASTTHHLPKPTAVHRYMSPDRVILRTDVDRRKGNDHIVCAKTEDGEVDCNYKDILEE